MLAVSSVALVIAGAAAAQTSPGAACDLDFVRTRAEDSYPAYRVVVRRGEQGVVTMRFTPRNGEGAFAIALRTVGTQLSTSIMTAPGIDDAERGRLAKPVTTWWQHADLQRILAACTGADSDGVDLAAAARTALQPESLHRRWRVAILLGVAWFVLAALLFVELLNRARSPAERLMLLGLFAYSCALNGLLCVGGPGNLRLSLVAVFWGDELDLRWGPAPVELFRLLAFALGGIDDVRIRSVNLVLGSLVPMLTYGIIAELGVGRVASLIAAFLIAAHPFSIAFSADLGRQPTYLFAAFGSILGLLSFLQRGGIGAMGAFVLGTILAVTSRPEGGHVLIVDAAILLLVPATPRRRSAAGVAFGLLGALAWIYVRTFMEYGGQMAAVAHASWGNPTALLWTIVLSPDFTPLAWILVWTIGLVSGVRVRPTAAWVGLVVLVGLHLAWSVTGLYANVVGYDRNVSTARYESILLLPFAIGAALFVESVLALRRRTALAIATLIGLLTLATYPRAADTLLRRFTVDDEYGFLRRHTLALPSDSVVYVLQTSVDDIGFVDAHFVALFVRPEIKFDVWNPLEQERMRSGADAVLYIGSSCAPHEDHRDRPLGPEFRRWLRECSSIRSRLAGSAIEEIDVPARKMSWYDFSAPTVRLGLYRLPASSGAE